MSSAIYEKLGRAVAAKWVATAEFATKKPAAGAKKKNCKPTSISCGFSCISGQKVCRITMTMEQQKAAKALKKELRDSKKVGSKDEPPVIKPENKKVVPKKEKAKSDPPTNSTLQQIQSTGTKFIKSSGNGDEAVAAAIKEFGGNITPVFVKEAADGDFNVVGNNRVAASAKRAGNDFTKTIALDSGQIAQLKIEELGAGTDDKLTKSSKKTFELLEQKTGLVTRLPTKFLAGKSSADPETIDQIAAALKETGRNVSPVFVRTTGPDSHEIVGNAHIAAAAKKAGLDFVWTVRLNDKQVAQLKAEKSG
jgi:hypothetical protein